MKTELEFKQIIENNISKRGEAVPLEQRMLKSITNHIKESGLSIEQIKSAKKLPNLDTIADSIGFDRLFYFVTQKMGSHHVHGTWPSLLIHYLRENDVEARYKFGPRDHDCSTHINQFMLVPRIVLDALRTYVRFFLNQPEAEALVAVFDSVELEIIRIYEKACENPDGPELNPS